MTRGPALWQGVANRNIGISTRKKAKRGQHEHGTRAIRKLPALDRPPAGELASVPTFDPAQDAQLCWQCNATVPSHFGEGPLPANRGGSVAFARALALLPPQAPGAAARQCTFICKFGQPPQSTSLTVGLGPCLAAFASEHELESHVHGEPFHSGVRTPISPVDAP